MRKFARLGAVVAAGTLTVSGLAAVAAPAEATPAKDTIGVDTGAAWITGQLTNGVLHNDQYNFDDVGLTIDVALALDAIGGHASTVTTIRDALATKIGGYVQADEYDNDGHFVQVGKYGNATAKALYFAQLAGATTSTYGGHNLVTDLEARITSSGNSVGRVNDDSSYGDYGNTIGQAYAAAALDTAHSGKAADALAFLLKQQCPGGGFRLSFTADASASGQNCTSDAQAQVDATSIAILELKSIGGQSGHVSDAESWLIGKQNPTTGSWGGDPGGSAANANATGLAAWALGNTSQSALGAAWLRDHQATYYDYCTKLKNDVGAIAYDDAGLTSGRSNGISTSAQDQFRRASAQALPGLKYLDADTTPAAPQLTGPSGYAKGGGTATFTVTGVHSGDQLCLTGGPGGAGGTATGTSWTKSAQLFDLTGLRTFTVRDRDGHSDSAQVNQLGSKSLVVTRAHYANKRSSFASVTIYGLAPGERASILFRGELKASGTADSAGHFARSIWTGRQLGTGTVGGYGQFGDIRKGYTTIKVVQ